MRALRSQMAPCLSTAPATRMQRDGTAGVDLDDLDVRARERNEASAGAAQRNRHGQCTE